MKIAELERVSGVSRSTIHFYRNVGLLPSPIRRGPKLHVYGREHLERLRWIGTLRKQGVPIEEIRRRRSARAEPRRSKPKQRTNATREQILEHAAREFLDRGFAEVHMADIARAASVGKAKIYEHFRSKTALFVESLDHLRRAVFGDEQRAMLGANLSFDDESRLRACAVLVRFAPYRRMANLLNEAAIGRDGAIARGAREALHRMVTNAAPMFERAIAEGHCRTIDTELVAYMTWGALLAVGDRLAIDDRYSLTEALDVYLDFMRSGLRAIVAR